MCPAHANNYDVIQCCKAIITKLSIVKHQHLDRFDAIAAHADIDDLLCTADRLGIPWQVQNALLYVGETYDVRVCYLNDLLNIAYNRAGITI